jgi:hypothetical protein
MKRTLVLFVAAVLVSVIAFAVDGTVLINQSTVTAAGGFPYKITQPGSYKLSGNLTVPLDLDGIDVLADGVSIDLNGFAIVGPGVFPTLSVGIKADDRRHIRITNGTITGMSTCIQIKGAATGILIDNVIADPNVRTASNSKVLTASILLGEKMAAAAVVTNFTAYGEMQLTCPSVLANGVVSDIVEVNIPPGTGFSNFGTNCTGTNLKGGLLP